MAGQVQTYTPDVAPISDNPDVRALADYVQQQFQLIAQSLVQTPFTQQAVLHVEPNKPRDGMIVNADGTDWNPGNGAGLYARVSGAWVWLGQQAQDLSGYLTKADNLASVTSAATSRTNLGLGTAATKDVGTSANNVVQLDGSSHLPGVDGSALLNLPSQTGRLVAGTVITINPYPTGGTTTASAHGLGSVPIYYTAHLVCLTAEFGYSIGDILDFNHVSSNISTIQLDTTNVTLVTQSAPQITRKDSHTNLGITPGNWKLVITPYTTS